MALARDIMDALAEALTGLPNANQVWPRLNLEPDDPCIDIYPDPQGMEEAEERGFSGTTGALLFVVRARVGVVDHDAAQDVLIDWMDPTNDDGVLALLQADETLNGVATSVDVGPVSGFVSFHDINGKIARLGAEWHVRVIPAYT